MAGVLLGPTAVSCLLTGHPGHLGAPADPGLASKLARGPGAHPKRAPDTPDALAQQAGGMGVPLPPHSLVRIPARDGGRFPTDPLPPPGSGQGRGLDPTPIRKWA